jgi:hypothetical protein
MSVGKRFEVNNTSSWFLQRIHFIVLDAKIDRLPRYVKNSKTNKLAIDFIVQSNR